MSARPATMRALVKARPEPGIWLHDDVEVPRIGPNDLLIRIRKTAICGTDLHIFHWDEWAASTIPTPMVVGHEFMGEVVEIGDAVAGFALGDRVSGEGHITCGHCRNCRAGRRHLCRNTLSLGVSRAGCFAEYLSLPAGNAFRLPVGISDDIASYLDPLGNAVHTALSFDLVGEDVLVTGAGPIGIMACAVARHVGARHVVATDPNHYRLDLAQKMGADRVLDPREGTLDDVMSDLGMREGFDVGLEMSGSEEAFRGLVESMNHGGRVAILGLPPREMAIDWTQVIFKGLLLKGVYGREMFETWYKMAAMLESGLDVRPVLTHHFAVSDYERGFETMHSGDCGKVVLDWSSA